MALIKGVIVTGTPARWRLGLSIYSKHCDHTVDVFSSVLVENYKQTFECSFIVNSGAVVRLKPVYKDAELFLGAFYLTGVAEGTI